MSNEDVYSNKDSNKNRKIEKRETSLFNALFFLCIMTFVGIYLYHGYLKPRSEVVVPKPVMNAEPVVPVKLPADTGDAHPYDTSKPPHQQ
jgi:hypothetical protein